MVFGHFGERTRHSNAIEKNALTFLVPLVSDTTKKKLLSETNRFRLMHDATPLGICPVCSDAAQIHADEIAKSGVVKPDHKAKYGQIIFSTKDQQDIEPGADYFGTLVPARMYVNFKSLSNRVSRLLDLHLKKTHHQRRITQNVLHTAYNRM